MAKYLRDVQITTPRGYTIGKKLWDEQEKRANLLLLSTNFLEYLYLDCLPRVETNGVPKVIINACPTRPQIALEAILRNPEILQLSKLFDFATYAKAGKQARKKIALKFLQDGLLKVAKIRGWDPSPFRVAYKAVLARNFAYYRSWGQSVSSPDKKHKAQVWCNFDSDKAEVFLVVHHRNAELIKTPIATVRPGYVWIKEISGKIKWLSASKVKLTSRDGKQSWEIVLPELSSTKDAK